MKPNPFKQIQLQLPALNSILFWIILAWALGSLGLGWLVKSLLVVIVVLAVLPVVALFVAQWWVKKKLVTGGCPACGFELTGVEKMALQCPSCGERLQVNGGRFQRYAEPGTIDVEVVSTDAIDVNVLPADPEDRR